MRIVNQSASIWLMISSWPWSILGTLNPSISCGQTSRGPQETFSYLLYSCIHSMKIPCLPNVNSQVMFQIIILWISLITQITWKVLYLVMNRFFMYLKMQWMQLWRKYEKVSWGSHKVCRQEIEGFSVPRQRMASSIICWLTGPQYPNLICYSFVWIAM